MTQLIFNQEAGQEQYSLANYKRYTTLIATIKVAVNAKHVDRNQICGPIKSIVRAQVADGCKKKPTQNKKSVQTSRRNLFYFINKYEIKTVKVKERQRSRDHPGRDEVKVTTATIIGKTCTIDL